jgi:hypothetical protein
VRLIPLLLLVLLTACGGGDDTAQTAPGSPPASPDTAPTPPGDDALAGSDPALNDLVVTQDLGDGSPPQRWTLVCAGAVSGDHPQAEAACAHLAAIEDPFAPAPADLVCTEVYGGPQTARVTGVWGGEPVELEPGRRDGCEIAEWDALGPLLPGPVGVAQ